MTNSVTDLFPQTHSTWKIRVLLVDDHALVRQGLRTFIELQEDMEVAGEASTGIEAVELAAQLRPDVILLDLVMPGMDGVEATRKILECSPRSRVLILTSFSEDDKIFPAVRAGAQGYLLKDIQPRDLILAVREMHQGKTQLHPDVAQRLMSAVAGNAPAQETIAKSIPQDLAGMTERELEAESIAFCVLSTLGFDTSQMSFGYIATWSESGGEDAVKEIKKSGQRILEASRRILDRIEENMGVPVELEKVVKEKQ